MSTYKLERSKGYLKLYIRQPLELRKLIDEFESGFQKKGWIYGDLLKARIKDSDQVPKNTENRDVIIKFAQDNKLKHYHIGYEVYTTSLTDEKLVSNYVIHFQHFGSRHIRLVGIDTHPIELIRTVSIVDS
ncbi:hypothetical protein [Aliivibrio wodanis]|uniref:hypothetical protein n=1 Tax=Aliivibrio wodanis TaxID=80852 RepID=UPI00406D19AC